MAATARRLARHEPTRDVRHGPARELKELLAQSQARTRRFVAQLSKNTAAPRASIRAADFLQAALSFLETFAANVSGNEVNVAVTDCETGERHCFALRV